jgi:formylglycine-generating enzyme required for sulfatase activity
MDSLAHARAVTDELFKTVRAEAMYDRPIPERHRFIFYLGHLEAFDWNLIARHALDRPAFHSEFDHLFAFGIDPPPGQLPQDVPTDWPSAGEVERYCRRVRDELDTLPIPEQLRHVAVEHRLMHAETLAYILHQLPYDRKTPPAVDAAEGVSRPTPGAAMVAVPPGQARLGRTPGEGFGWDNEFLAHMVDVPAFEISRAKVSNGEYLEFVRQGAPAPFFWTERDGQYFYRGMWQEIPLRLDWPVYCTHDEATAYANWRGMRLPSEPEFHRAACGATASVNLDFRRWDPISVDEGAPGIQQIADGWEWLGVDLDCLRALPGFPALPLLPELLRAVLRRPALRAEGRLAADRRVFPPRLVS